MGYARQSLGSITACALGPRFTPVGVRALSRKILQTILPRGAALETRCLGKSTLYQLSYSRVGCEDSAWGEGDRSRQVSRSPTPRLSKSAASMILIIS